jgi:hypothetical protein
VVRGICRRSGSGDCEGVVGSGDWMGRAATRIWRWQKDGDGQRGGEAPSLRGGLGCMCAAMSHVGEDDDDDASEVVHRL